MNKLKALTGLIATAGLLGGCAQTTELEPAPAARTPAEDTAVAATAGVRMRVEAEQWPGAAGVTDEVTPVRVRIENGSAVPLRIRYSEFALVGPDGRRYAALPPYRVEGEIIRPEAAGGYAPVDPGFDFSGYALAPAYSPLYPDMAVFTDPFVMDPLYYDRYYGYWEDTELPTQDMLQLALPEGVLAAGGSLNGYLYFEKVPEDQRLRLQYEADLVNAESGQTFAEVEIPFIANPRG